MLACGWSRVTHRVAAWAEPGQTQSMLTTDITDCAGLTLNIHTFALTVTCSGSRFCFSPAWDLCPLRMPNGEDAYVADPRLRHQWTEKLVAVCLQCLKSGTVPNFAPLQAILGVQLAEKYQTRQNLPSLLLNHLTGCHAASTPTPAVPSPDEPAC